MKTTIDSHFLNDMNAHHVKYTIEFDIPIKIDGYDINPMVYKILDDLFSTAIKSQRIYFKKDGSPPYHTRSKNTVISHESSIVPFEFVETEIT